MFYDEDGKRIYNPANIIPKEKCEPKEEKKEAEKVEEKLYTTGQMIDMLLENETLIATSDHLRAYVKNHVIICDNSNGEYVDNFAICPMTWKRQWRIIEPEPQKVSFVEAFKACLGLNGIKKGIKSIVSGEAYWINSSRYSVAKITDSEIDSEWIILD
jgi:hypothetical protein